jgi:VCBS repeat protein
MNLPRRRFLGSSLFVFGSTLMDALTTPLWRWRRSLILQSTASSNQPSPVQFVDVAHEAGLNTPNVWGATDHKSYIIEAKGSGIAFFDYDNDGWLEQAGMGVAVGDYDCDGWLDIFKTNFADDTCNLYHNNGDGTFSEATFASGIAVNTRYVGWGCGFIDYDNDGWLDILQINGHVYPEIDKNDVGQTYKNPRLMYRNMGNGRFKDVSAAMGPGITEHFSSRGAAFGDYDNDGDVDVLVLNMNDVPSLLRNAGGNKQKWIKMKLIGTKCNRTAIGARVRVVTGNRAQIDEVHSGSSVMSQGDLRFILAWETLKWWI